MSKVNIVRNGERYHIFVGEDGFWLSEKELLSFLREMTNVAMDIMKRMVKYIEHKGMV